MIALVRYMLQDLFRSNRYFMPALTYGIFVLWLYSLRPNPVLESYSLTTAVLFANALWLSRLLEGVEAPRQLELTVLHSGGFKRYAWARVVVYGLLGLVFALWAVLVPVLTGAFEAPANVGELGLAFYSHVIAFFLGCGLGWAVGLWLRLPQVIMSGAFFFLALTLAAGGIARLLPDWLSWLIWLLPPVHPLMQALIKFHSLDVAALVFHVSYPLVYAAGLFWLLVHRFSRLRG